MKTIGIVGGLGPESTIDYYRLLIAAHREAHADGSFPRIVINSVDMQAVLGFVETQALDGLADFLGQAVGQLARASAEIGLLAANTPHLVFDEIQRRSPIPLVSIVESARDAAKELGLRRLGLFGTRFTMQARFYPDVFARTGIGVAVPQSDEQDFIHDKYMNELVPGVLRPETREGLLAIARAMKSREGIDGLILGGTELPLILRGENNLGLPFLDTAQIHVKAVMARAAAF